MRIIYYSGSLLLLIQVLFLNSFLYAQAGPGEVGLTNLTGWWKADFLPEGNVLAWPVNSSSVMPIAMMGTAPFYPQSIVPITGRFNYNRVVSFAGDLGNDYSLKSDELPLLLDNQSASSEGTFFCVFSANSINDDAVVTYKNSISGSGVQLRGRGLLAIGHGNSTNGTRDFTVDYINKAPLIVGYKGNKSSATSMVGFKNDAILPTASLASSAVMNTSLTFGAKKEVSPVVYDELFHGELAEVIFYNIDLTDEQILKVNSYLAVKYGITLSNEAGGSAGNYLAPNGHVIWNSSLNSAYHNDVIGVGRADEQDFNQRQSKTLFDDFRVFVGALESRNSSNSTFLTNNYGFLMVGTNGLEANATEASNLEQAVALPIYSRIAKEWKVTNTAFTNDYSVSIKLSNSAALSNVDVADLRFIIDDDGDFSNGGTSIFQNGDAAGTVIIFDNPFVTISGIGTSHFPLNDTRYFTLGSAQDLTPLGIGGDSFYSDCYNQRIILKWLTNSTEVINCFVISKSVNGFDFKEVERIDVGSNVMDGTSFSWTDYDFSSDAYYKLHEVRVQGDSSIIGVVKSPCIPSLKLKVVPNPVTDDSGFQVVGKLAYPLNITIVNTIGATVYTTQLHAGQTQVSLQGLLSDGSYLVKVSNEQMSEILRVVIRSK